MSVSPIAVVLVVSLLLGSSSSLVLAAQAGAPSAQTDRDLAELRAYRLTMPKLKQMVQAYRALLKSMESIPQVQALKKTKTDLRGLEAKLEALDAKEQPSDADMQQMEQLQEQMQKLQDQIDSQEEGLKALGGGVNPGQNQTLSDMARAIDAMPAFASAVQGAGLTTREFAVVQLALFQSMMAFSITKSGMVKELPKEISTENVQFLKENEAEVMALMKEVEALGNEFEGNAPKP